MFYTGLLLLASSVLLLIISTMKESTRFLRRRWSILSIIFLGLALDEGTSFHEFLNVNTLQAYAPTSKCLRWTWVIPYGVFTSMVFIWHVPFLRSLPRRTAGLLLAGALYVGGAMGVELIGSAFYTVQGSQSLGYGMTTHVKEFLEMIGLIMFIYGLLDYLMSIRWVITLQHTLQADRASQLSDTQGLH